MTNTPHNNGPSLAWLERAAEAEDACRSISVGGLAADLGMLSPDEPKAFEEVVKVLVESSKTE